MQLQGKTVVLTGATGGIGQCMARALADAGACLLLVGRDQLALEKLRINLSQVSATHSCFVADLCDRHEREALVRVCQDQKIDFLINNAGIGEFNLLEESEDEVIFDLLNLNLNVPIQLTRLLLPHLKSRPQAAIINVGSTFGSIGYPGYSIYSASKFGLRGFSEALRRELSDSTVRVLYLAPRATRTDLNSECVVAMNAALGVAMDAPEKVARILISSIKEDRWGARSIGWPERLYAWINAVLPRLIDNAVSKQLGIIRHFARHERDKDIYSDNS